MDRTIKTVAVVTATALVAVPIITFVEYCHVKAWWRKRNGKSLYCDDV